MSAVSLVGAMLGAAADGETGSRPSADTGSSFGDALLVAGRELDASEGRGRPEGDADSAADGERPGVTPTPTESHTDAGAMGAALLQLAAQATGAMPGPGASTPGAGVDDDGAMPVPSSGGTALAGSVSNSGAAAQLAPLEAESAVSISTPSTASPSAQAAEAGASATTGAAAVTRPGRASESPTPGAPSASTPAPAPGVTVEAAAGPVGSAPTPGRATTEGSAQAAPTPPPVLAAAPSVPTAAGASDDGVTSREAGERIAPTTGATASGPVVATAPAPPVAPAAGADASAPVARAVAAQVAPVVVSIAQRPSGTHQLTMTVNPDSLGPVTVRAHISAAGEVRVELSGATDAGRDALRTILTDLRRDLAAVMPHATLSVGGAADASGDRGGQSGAGSAAADQSGTREGSARDGGAREGGDRGRSALRTDGDLDPSASRLIKTTPHAGLGAGLDIFA